MGDVGTHGGDSLLRRLKARAKELKRQTLIVYFAARDPRTPVIVRVLALLIAAYALSPIDLIPDAIPVLGYLDDIIIVPLGLALVLRLIPLAVRESAQMRAAEVAERPISYTAATIIVIIWIAGTGLIVWRLFFSA